MKRVLFLTLAVVSCGVDLEVPDNVQVTCQSDADCAAGRVCAPLIGQCVLEIDAQAPRLVGADTPAEDRVRVVFSEPVACSAAGDKAAYAITPALAVSAASGSGCAAPDDGTTEVVLFTELQAPGQTYVLTAGGIADSGGNPLAVDGAAVQFTGFGQAPDATPPDALSPPNHARVLGATQGLVWTRRPGASQYIVEVATDAAFTAHIAGSPFTVAAPATSLPLSGLSDVTYFWRVRSDLTPGSATPAVNDFDVLVDTVYVACPPSGPCTEGGLRNGSRTRPYASVQRALAAAAELSTSLTLTSVAVKIAARGPAAAYAGPVILQWQSVRLLGGYDATFTTRDPSPDVTVIEGSGTVLAVSNLPAPISGLIEGLTLRTSATTAIAPVLNVTAASSTLTVRNVVVTGAVSNTLQAAVSVSGGPAAGPLFESCVFESMGGPGETASVLFVDSAAPTFRGTTVRVAEPSTGTQDAFLVKIRGPLPGDAVFEGCTIIGPATTGASRAIELDFSSTSPGRVVLRKSLVATGAAPDSSVFLSTPPARVLIEDSVVSAGPGSPTCHVFGEGGSAEVIIRNSVVQSPKGPGIGCEVIETPDMVALEITGSVIIGSDGGSTPLVLTSLHPVITNSIFVGLGGQTCVDQLWRDADDMNLGTPTSFQNNATVGCAYAYVVHNGVNDSVPATLVSTTTELDALNGMPIRDTVCPDLVCPQAPFAGNVVLGSVAVFVDADGPDDDLSTIEDNDYHLSPAADLAVRQGGLAAGSSVCAPIGQSGDCHISAKDFDDDDRIAPCSMGPDEQD